MLNLLDGFFKFDLGEGAFYAVFGLLFVFAGIALLIGIFTLLGFVMKKGNARKSGGARERTSAVGSVLPEREEDVPPETVAVIAAALAAYYEAAPQKCDFVVRRIKRL